MRKSSKITTLKTSALNTNNKLRRSSQLTSNQAQRARYYQHTTTLTLLCQRAARDKKPADRTGCVCRWAII